MAPAVQVLVRWKPYSNCSPLSTLAMSLVRHDRLLVWRYFFLLPPIQGATSGPRKHALQFLEDFGIRAGSPELIWVPDTETFTNVICWPQRFFKQEFNSRPCVTRHCALKLTIVLFCGISLTDESVKTTRSIFLDDYALVPQCAHAK